MTTEEADITKTLELTEKRFDNIFDQVHKIFKASDNSTDFLEALMTIPNTKNEAILIGTIFQKVQVKMGKIMEAE